MRRPVTISIVLHLEDADGLLLGPPKFYTICCRMAERPVCLRMLEAFPPGVVWKIIAQATF